MKNILKTKILKIITAFICCFGMFFSVASSAASSFSAAYAETVEQSVTSDVDLPSLEVRLQDENGNAIQGASIGLYSDRSCRTSLKQAQTGQDGTASFDYQIEKGKSYYIKEISSVAGYIADEDTHTLVLTDISPNDDLLTFAYDGKTYGTGDGIENNVSSSDEYRVDGNWGNMKISVLMENEKDASVSDTENQEENISTTPNGQSSDTENTSDSSNGTGSTSADSGAFQASDGSDTGINSGTGTIALLSIVAVCAAVYLYKTKKTNTDKDEKEVKKE